MPYWPRYLPPPIVRFERYIVRIPEAGCWIWDGAACKHGYGRINVGGKVMLSHRFAYEHFNGPIATGMFLCHHCDIPACCNPHHMFVGTQKDNMADAMRKDRMARGERRPQSVLNEEQILEIRAANGMHAEIAKRYGVHRMTIGKIKRGIRWSHVK